MQVDTLDYAKRLETAGVPAPQAEARLETSIDAMKTELVTSIDAMKTELKLELGGKLDTLKWMFGVLVALNVGIMIRLLYIH